MVLQGPTCAPAQQLAAQMLSLCPVRRGHIGRTALSATPYSRHINTSFSCVLRAKIDRCNLAMALPPMSNASMSSMPLAFLPAAKFPHAANEQITCVTDTPCDLYVHCNVVASHWYMVPVLALL